MICIVHAVMKKKTTQHAKRHCQLPVISGWEGRAHRDVEIYAALVLVVADKNGLHPNVGHVNGAREEEEDSQTGK